MFILKKITDYFNNNYTTPEDKVIFEVYKKEAEMVENFDSMKATDGWKVLEKNIREELRTRLREGVKDDAKAQALLDILVTVETTERSRLLEEEINQVIPK